MSPPCGRGDGMGRRPSPLTSYGVRKGSPTSGGRFRDKHLAALPRFARGHCHNRQHDEELTESRVWMGGRPAARSVADANGKDPFKKPLHLLVQRQSASSVGKCPVWL